MPGRAPLLVCALLKHHSPPNLRIPAFRADLKNLFPESPPSNASKYRLRRRRRIGLIPNIRCLLRTARPFLRIPSLSRNRVATRRVLAAAPPHVSPGVPVIASRGVTRATDRPASESAAVVNLKAVAARGHPRTSVFVSRIRSSSINYPYFRHETLIRINILGMKR